MKPFLFNPASQAKRRRCGFTLAEVTIAMGVVSVGLLGLVSLLALALDGVREASSNLVGSQIASSLMADMQAAPWDELSSRNGLWSYYDGSGQPVTSTTEASFTAHVSLNPPRDFGCDVKVCIMNAPVSRAKQEIQDYLDDQAKGYEVAVFTSQIVRLEK